MVNMKNKSNDVVMLKLKLKLEMLQLVIRYVCLMKSIIIWLSSFANFCLTELTVKIDLVSYL